MADTTSNDVPPAISDAPHGDFTGQCKWWSNRLNYGFITIIGPSDKGVDLFCHHTGIKPLNSKYRTLRKGEYCNFDVIDGAKGRQATRVTGIGGGPLMCDVNPYIPRTVPPNFSAEQQSFGAGYGAVQTGYGNVNPGFSRQILGVAWAWPGVTATPDLATRPMTATLPALNSST